MSDEDEAQPEDTDTETGNSSEETSDNFELEEEYLKKSLDDSEIRKRRH